MKYTAEKVRDYADACRLAHKGPVIADMLTELAERIKVDESAAPVGFVMEATATRHKFGLLTQDLPPGAELFTHPPAQPAQVDLRNSLLRGKAQNEEPRVRHLCNMGVGCEEAGICYAEANGQPEQCGRPTAEPVAQDDWRIGFFEGFARAAREKGYAGIAEAITAAPTAPSPGESA